MTFANAVETRFVHAPRVRVLNAAGPEAPRHQVDTITVGSYNVKNMFDAVDPDPERGNRPKPEGEMAALARVIERSGADVITLQEVENLGVLEEFLDEYLPGQFAHAALVEGNDTRGIDVAVISKFPVTNVVSHKDNTFQLPNSNETTQFRRDALRVDLQVGEYPFSVYTVHLKSRRGGAASYPQRKAETEELRRIVNEEMKPFPSNRFVVTGDFNASPRNREMLEFYSGKPGDEPLVDSLEGKPWAERDTWPADDPSWQLDHIVYPEHMRDNLVDSHVNDDPEAARASDHRLLLATFTLKD